MFLFGVKMLWDAWRMSPDEAEEIQQEVREELERRGSIASSLSHHSQEEATAEGTSEEVEPRRLSGQDLEIQLVEQGENEEAEVQVRVEALPKRTTARKKTVQIREKSLFGKKCYKIFK